MTRLELEPALTDLAHRELVLSDKNPRQSLARFRIRQLRKRQVQIYQRVEARLTQSSVASRAEEWLLDNRHVIEDAIEELHEQLPDRYLGKLPGLNIGKTGKKGGLRIEALARQLLKAGQLPLDADWLEQQIDRFQDLAELSIGELWALPGLLALCILEQVMDKAEISLTVAQASGPAGDQGPAQAMTGVIAGLIISLRMIDAHDWHGFFERVSRVERALGCDPIDAYAGMEFDSRNRYRNVVERLARGSRHSETAIAQTAIRLALSNADCDPRRRHVGYYLIGGGLAELEIAITFRPRPGQRFGRFANRHPESIYFGVLALLMSLPLLSLVWLMIIAGLGPTAIAAATTLTILPASGLAMALLNGLLTWLIPSRPLARMDYETGIPEHARSIIVMPVLVGDPSDVIEIFERLESNFLGNKDPRLVHAILADFTDADQPEVSSDQNLLDQARHCLEQLGRRHGEGRFLFLCRRRLFNPAEQRWMGWERKRGKLEEFNRLLGGATDSSYDVILGQAEALEGLRYVITLDADTRLPPDTAYRLVGTIDHPLSRAALDPDAPRLKAGYSIIQPRLEVDPEHGADTWFSRMFSGDRSLDIYTHATSDAYHDLFGQGIFTGKGIYDWRALEHCLGGAIPENTVLSHDLLEGLYSRVGLASDLVLLEQFPPTTATFMRRLHRWIRGDWQLLPWLGWRVRQADGSKQANPLGRVGRWKIIDNLRRSLLAPALLVLLNIAWFGWLPGSALAATLLLTAFSAAPLWSELLGLLTRLLARPRYAPLVAINALPGLRRQASHWLINLMLLPYQSGVLIDAIARSIYRMTISRRRLLQWTTAAQAHKRLGQGSRLGPLLAEMWLSPSLALGSAVLLALVRPESLLIAAPLLIAWLLAPLICWWLDRPIQPRRPELTQQQTDLLRTTARRTWLFFEHFVTPDNHWLPPDNYQEVPRVALARRTSPTNIGMGLNAVLAAHDFGWIDIRSLLAWLENSMERMNDLERYRGHWLNWYETENLQPLNPRYVSTVDSGNLAAGLIVLARAMEEFGQQPIKLDRLLAGLADTLAVIADTLQALPDSRRLDQLLPVELAWLDQRRHELNQPGQKQCYRALVEFRGQHLEQLNQRMLALAEDSELSLSKETLFQLRVWLQELKQQCQRIEDLIAELLPWVPACAELTESEHEPIAQESDWQRLEELLLESWSPASAGQSRSQVLSLLSSLSSHQLSPALGDFLSILPDLLDQACDRAARTQRTLDRLKEQAEQWLSEMEFGFLYDRNRQLFRIGYDLDSGRLDNNHYDLLASESRLASLVAIAKGDVPLRHWMHLGRPYRRRRGRAILMSWGATLFEYLMPELYTRQAPGTLLRHAGRAAIRLHRRFTQALKLPWGISESGYYQLDEQKHYQYRSFGVPMLGFRRDLGDRLVISPYASIMALSREPNAVLDNLEQLRAARALGLYGFHEAIDYGRREKLTSHRPRVVHSWMSHHQGMALLAINNFLNDQAMVRRFHADLRIGSAAMLLYESKPLMPPRLRASRQPRVGPPIRVAPRPELWPVQPGTENRQASCLSNGHFNMLATASGCSSASWNDIMLTRWQPDRTTSQGGHRFLIRDLDQNQQLIFGHAPDPEQGERSSSQMGPHKAEIQRSAHGLICRLRLAVSSQHDIQVQHLRISNDTENARRVLLVSHAEVAMAPVAEFDRHPAFARLFVETEQLEKSSTLLFRKRPRSGSERPIYMAHQLIRPLTVKHTIGWDTDRASFLGRGRRLENAIGLTQGAAGMAARTGAVLDPAIALAVEMEIPAYTDVELAFLTGASHSRRELLANMAYYRSLGRIEWLFEQAAMQTAQETHLLGITHDETREAMSLLASAIWPEPENRQLDGPRLDQAIQLLLFSRGVSGDWPIILVRIHADHEPAQLDRLIRMHTFLGGRQWRSELVLIDESAGGYGQPSRDYLQTSIDEIRARLFRSLSGRVILISGRELAADQRHALEHAASVVLDATGRGLVRPERESSRLQLPELITSRNADWSEMSLPASPGLVFSNGFGGFDPARKAYVIEHKSGEATPAPWSNVLANPHFGSLVSGNGSMCSWCGNASESRISPWLNDPVGEGSGEVLYLRDEETGEVWTPTPAPMPAPGDFRITHGLGWTRFEHASKDLLQSLNVHVDAEDPVKLVQLELHNQCSWTRRITATFYLEWVLGTNRIDQAHHLTVEADTRISAILAQNPFSPRAGQACAFLASATAWHGYTTCRREFLGDGGTIHQPAGLGRIGLGSQLGGGLDPCAAIQVHLDIPPGQSRSALFLVGQGSDADQARALIERYSRPQTGEQSLAASRGSIQQLLATVQVSTPEPAMDLMLNQWLPYQALMGRLWGRTGYYQSSGAFGYRDQLQDMLAMLWFDPAMVRQHLLLAASRQFIEGDVLHWWHEQPLRGVRTRCSDDLLWLPYAVAHYVKVTGDRQILNQRVAYLDGAPLAAEETERYAEFRLSERHETLYEHCKRAIDRSAAVGPHGLPVIGNGDWNDGMNHVSVRGSGESVWLGWFLIRVLDDFAVCCDNQAEPGCAEQYRTLARHLHQQIDQVAWDGEWYQRAYFDDGSPLGSAANQECQIDLIAQAWSVMGPEQPGKRATQAMNSALDRLVDEENRLIKLLTPAFDTGPQNPGYIKGYPPGVRENGAQYTHAATWSVWAMASLGQGDRAMALFRLLNPILRSHDKDSAEGYRLEPYVLAGDIYSVGDLAGRGGWSWYTGAAAWLYRAGIEALLGLSQHGDQLHIRPCLPVEWPGYSAVLNKGNARYEIEVHQHQDPQSPDLEVKLDGVAQPGESIDFIDDGNSHQVQVRVQARKSE